MRNLKKIKYRKYSSDITEINQLWLISKVNDVRALIQ